MIVDGRAVTPAAWVEGLQGDTVELDGVEMMWVGAAAKDAGGSATIEMTPDGKMLSLRAGIRTMEFVILPPGEFWRHPWVRGLIADASVYQLQALPWWPYVEANIPAHPPHTVDWERPYLDWEPDEAWLLLNLMPPPPVEDVPAAAGDDEDAEEDEDATEDDEEAAEEDVDVDVDVDVDTGTPAGAMGGGPPPGAMGGGPPGPGGEEPPPMEP
jgi:hypothetical protein